MIHKHAVSINDFSVAHTALRDTQWLAEPDNPVNPEKGSIQKGDIIWFHPDHFGSGPAWLQARLGTKTMGYVHLSDFAKAGAQAG